MTEPRTQLIVSMTTWEKRVDQAHLTVQSILDQTRQPDLVEINLSYENFPQGILDIPDSLKKIAAEHKNVELHFYPTDLHCWLKCLPTWRRHKGEAFIDITVDDDYTYPSDYVEKTVKAMVGHDWGCTQHEKYTMGQFMVYRSSLTDKIVDKFTDKLVLDCPLDDHGIFWAIQGVANSRCGTIDSVPLCRGTGWSFRRNYYPDQDASKMSQGEYPFEAFVRERKILHEHGIG